VYSNFFTDLPLLGTTNGTVTARPDGVLLVTDSPLATKGVLANVTGGTTSASISACVAPPVVVTIDPDKKATITCTSAEVIADEGPVGVYAEWLGHDVVVSVPSDNSVLFDILDNVITVTAGADNVDTLIVIIDGEPIELAPGETTAPDIDGDGVNYVDDVCHDSVIPDSTGTQGLKPNHVGIDYVSADGCTCEQILYCKPGADVGEYKFGCAPGTINVWTEKIGWSNDCWSEGAFGMGQMIQGEAKDPLENTDNTDTIDAIDPDNDNDAVLDQEESLPEDNENDGKPDWWCDKHPTKC
jgi:hypothetical protein